MTAQPYVIFFRGLDGLIDEAAARRLAKNRGGAAVFYHYGDWREAAGHVAANPDAPNHVVGFSRGAAPDVMGGFMREVRKRGLRLPEDLMTVGLYGGTRRYKDPHFECINYLDSSGQAHDGEHDCVNLGAHVPHLGHGSGMEHVADRFAKPAEAAPMRAAIAPSPPLAGESWRGGTGGAASSGGGVSADAASPSPPSPAGGGGSHAAALNGPARVA